MKKNTNKSSLLLHPEQTTTIKDKNMFLIQIKSPVTVYYGIN